MKKFELKEYEIDVLRAINRLEKANKKTDFHSVIKELNPENSGTIIPVISRLEDDGYITSKGLIYRYMFLTQKGKDTIGA